MGMGRLLSQASKLPIKELGLEAQCELGSQGGSDHQRWALAGQSLSRVATATVWRNATNLESSCLMPWKSLVLSTAQSLSPLSAALGRLMDKGQKLTIWLVILEKIRAKSSYSKHRDSSKRDHGLALPADPGGGAGGGMDPSGSPHTRVAHPSRRPRLLAAAGQTAPDQPPLQGRGSTPSSMNVHLFNLNQLLPPRQPRTPSRRPKAGTGCPHGGRI